VAGRTAEHIQTRSGLEVGSLSSFNCTLAVAKLVLVMGYTSDSMPHVGDVPEKPGKYILGGFKDESSQSHVLNF
jgi:hypothetical protein